MAVILLAAVLPVDRELELPAYWQARSVVTLYAPLSGQLTALPAPEVESVTSGEVISRSPRRTCCSSLNRPNHDLQSSRYQMERTSFSAGLAQNRLSLQASLQGALETRTNLQAQLDDASLTGTLRRADRGSPARPATG